MHDNIKLFSNILFYYFPDELAFSALWWDGPVPDEYGEEPAHNINC